ncbi:hypothetical protein KEM55_007262, partial [Ascosphaera atra]
MQHHEQKGLTIVLKLGTSSIVDERTREPILSILTLIVEAAVTLKKAGHNVIIVSSGAVGVGLRRMDMAKRPAHVPAVQALAAIGQCRLMSLWDSLFEHLRQPIAQVLLTRNDISDATENPIHQCTKYTEFFGEKEREKVRRWAARERMEEDGRVESALLRVARRMAREWE